MTMKKLLLIISIMLLASSCIDHDEFDFAGTVVDYEECNGISELGYAVSLSSPDSIGKDYITRDGVTYHNVVVCYKANRMLRPNEKIKGSIYLDPKYSRTECYFHFDRDVPEAVFTKVEKI